MSGVAMQGVLVIGATSAIAQETSRLFAADGARLFLAARDAKKIKAVADDLRVRGARSVDVMEVDLADARRHRELLDAAARSLGVIDAVLVAHATLPDQRACEADADVTRREFVNNGLGTILLLTLLGQYFESRRAGCIAVITSVAGDRGRPSNYVYGSAKAAVDVFLQGLRARLYRQGVTVLTIRPGFVDTPMTAALPKNLLFATPSYVGRRIHAAMLRGGDVIYVPWFWRWIMAVVKAIPESVFKRLRI